MADIRHGAELSAAWILARREQQANSSTSWSEAASQVADKSQNGQTSTKEAVSKLIAAYLETPAHISTNLFCW